MNAMVIFGNCVVYFILGIGLVFSYYFIRTLFRVFKAYLVVKENSIHERNVYDDRIEELEREIAKYKENEKAVSENNN